MTRKYITKKYKIKKNKKLNFTKNIKGGATTSTATSAVKSAATYLLNKSPTYKTFMDSATGFIYFFLTALSLPLKTIDQIIPINLCKNLTAKNKGNKFCTNKLSEYFITGSKQKQDLSKNIINDSCIKLNEFGQYVKCKPNITGGTLKITGGTSTLSGSGSSAPTKKFYGKKFMNKAEPYLERASNFGLDTVVGIADTPGRISNVASPYIKTFKQKASNFGKGALTKAKAGVAIARAGVDLAHNYVYNPLKSGVSVASSGIKRGVSVASSGISAGISSTRDKLNDYNLAKYNNNRLKIIKEKLKKLINFLRQYKNPEEKMKSIIDSINDIEILKKVKIIYEAYITITTNEGIKDYGIGKYRPNPNISDSRVRGNACDKLFYDTTTPLQNPDIEYYNFTSLIDSTETPVCTDCNVPNSALSVLKNYYKQIQYLFEGNKKYNINYIIINILHEIIILNTKGVLINPGNINSQVRTINTPQSKGTLNDIMPLGTSEYTDSINKINNEIIIMLKNINCRCNIIDLLDKKINELDNLKAK